MFYNSFSQNLKSIFKERVHKISIMTGLSCPNRDGTLSNKGCVFCDPYGSGFDKMNYPDDQSIKEQIINNMDKIKKRFKCDKFIAYFQAFSNTNTSPENLKKITREALSIENIVGISISTRPDLFSDEIIEVLSEINLQTYLWVEIGIQSANEKTLELINRNHTFEDVIISVSKLHEHKIKVCGHVIIGLPGESRDDILNTAKSLTKIKIDGIKIHPLFIAKNSQLETEWKKSKIKLIDEDIYIKLVVDFLEHSRPETSIHRIVGSGRKDVHVAPDWCLKKHRVIQKINDEFRSRNSKQGKHYCQIVD